MHLYETIEGEHYKVEHYINSYCIQILNKSKTTKVSAIKDWELIQLETLL